MTATVAPPRPAADDGPPISTRAPRRTERHVQLGAEVALVAVTLATALSFGRVFDKGDFFAPLAVIVIAGHLASAAARRFHIPVALSAVLVGVAGVFVIAWVLYPFTTNHGLPTGLTFRTAGHDFSDAWDAFRVVKAPTPALRGFLLTAAIALWVTTFVSDWAAFRLWVPFETIIPSGTLFLFASMFGTDTRRTLYALIYAIAVLVFMLLHRVARQQSSTAWLAPDVGPGTRSLLQSGGVIAALAVLLASVAGPFLPGAHSGRLWDWQAIDSGPSSRQTVSPLVQIKGRLTDRSADEVFTVESATRSYWRLTALDDFDGDVWSSKGSFGQADDSLSDAVPYNGPHTVVEQTYTISGLSSIWLPAAFEPTGIFGDVDARWEPQSSTLIVDTNQTTSDGLVYRVDSEVPQFTAAELAADPAGAPRTIESRDLRLPDDFPERVRSLAVQVAGDQHSPYEKALTLQNFFRQNFHYSLSAPSGHSDTAIESFLFDTQTGYCEQFAGSYAAMARAIGLPARVAVGFTPGVLGEDGLYHVRGEHAHAWPEVFISGAGWVAFEPTPGRGEPGAEAYTGVVEQQAATGQGGTATTVQSSSPSATPLTEPPTVSFPSPGGTAPVASGGDTNHVPSAIDRFASTWAPRIGIAILVLAAIGLVSLLLVPSLRFLRRARRRRKAETAADRLHVAWAESVEAVAPIGVTPTVSETRTEFAARAGRVVAPDAYATLADEVDAAAYAATSPDDASAEHALSLADDIRSAARSTATPAQRVRAAVDPRDLLPALTGARRQRVGTAPKENEDRIEPVRGSR
jgi:transglutaminase-like putative cysteine protease